MSKAGVVLCFDVKKGEINDLKTGPVKVEGDKETEQYITKITTEAGSEKKQPVYRVELATWESTRQFFNIRGWKEWDPKDGNVWNIFWRENRVVPFVIKNCHQCQRVNKFRSVNGITLKDNLATGMREMQQKYGSMFGIVPQTWVLPEERKAFEDVLNGLKGSKDDLYICKPARLSRGRNIFLFKDIKTFEANTVAKLYTSSLSNDKKEVDVWVVQEYLANPCLISGYKFDLRLYVLISSVWPLEAFLYRRGLVRFATSKFDVSESANLFAHLTNSSINKDSATLNSEKGKVGKGCKWRLKKLFEHLKSEGKDTELLWKQIKEVVLLTLIPMVGKVPREPAAFEYFGFDVMLDSNLRPYIIEVNSGPAMSMKMPEDKVVKVPMVNDMFNLLRLDDLPSLPSTHFEEYKRGRATRRKPKKTATNADKKKETKSGQRAELGLDMSKKGDWEMVFPFNEATEKVSRGFASKFVPMPEKGSKPTASEKEIDGFMTEVLGSIKATYGGKSPW